MRAAELRARIRATFLRLAGVRTEDSDELRLRKVLITTFNLMVIPAGVVWGAIYIAFDEGFAATYPLIYVPLSLINLAGYQLHRRLTTFRDVQLFLILILPFLLMMALGGFRASGAVVLWSLLAPLAAVILCGPRLAAVWFGAFLSIVLVSVVLEPSLARTNNVPAHVTNFFFGLNIVTPSFVALALLIYFVDLKDRAMRDLAREREKAERLLLNVLPKPIAEILRDGKPDRTIADHYPSVSVLFADVVDSTALTTQLNPQQMVELLNEVFSYFDSLVDKYGVEKIRTIGDNYMVACGVPTPRPDHAHVLAAMALEMNDFLRSNPSEGARRLRFRIGMNCGPVVAGVVGTRKFQYDVWGDIVNTASRMESYGESGKIQITREMYEVIKDRFTCRRRGVIEVKGKGPVEAWFLEGFRSEAPPLFPAAATASAGPT